jgi:hypothetical protein
MQQHRIPASITLAQAIVESGWGDGFVARQANNYFCIKRNNGWDGPVVKAQDDDPDSSSFRQYASIEESFTDHSKFLKENSRYQPLFELSIYDYKGWARGLKACGYATKSDYAEYLIATIEKYGLYMYDYASPETMPNSIGQAGAFAAGALDLPAPVLPPMPKEEGTAAQGQAEPAKAEDAQPAMVAPQYHFDRASVTGAMTAPAVKLQSEGQPVSIPLILPKATAHFDRR